MKDSVLITHVIVSVFGIVAGVLSVVSVGRVQKVATRVSTPAILLIITSGCVVAFMGGSIVRACGSGVMTLGAVLFLKYYSTKRTDKKTAQD